MTGTMIRVSKLDAARRQLDTAIELWFRDGDSVSIEALVNNAHQIIQDINEKKGNKEVTVLEMVKRHVKPEHVEDVMRLWKKPVTFLKHANRDPHDILEFSEDGAGLLIILCINGLAILGEQPSDLARAFTWWQSFHRPDLFLKGANPAEKHLSVEQRENLRRLDKSDFLKAALIGFAQGRAKHV
jgi:hypothetical protein